MTLDVVTNGLSLRPVLSAAPRIVDQLNGVCRALEITAHSDSGIDAYLGQAVGLYYGGKRWFFGFLMREAGTSNGATKYLAYDPLYFMKRNPDDWYFKGMTATQAFRQLAEKSGVKIASLANTGAVLQPLYYPGAPADKVGIDLLARTYEANNKKYWFNYKPDLGSDGLRLFEKVVPKMVWAFQVGINLEKVSYERSIEETATVIKLINRETGKTVTRVDQPALKKYGQLVHFEEVDKDEAKTMEKKAQELLKKLGKVKVTMDVEGINPDQVIPQLYSGDVIYVEEPRTKIIGGYYIRNVTQTFESDSLVRLAFDVQAAPEIPEIQYQDAVNKGTEKAAVAGSNAAAAKAPGVAKEYPSEIDRLIEKYGL